MKKKITAKAYLDLSKVNTLEDYYTQENIIKAMVGCPQTKREITEFIERITSATIDSLFIGDTVAVYKHGRNLIRIPKDAVNAVPVNTTKAENPKKVGFFRRIWNWLTGK